MSFAGFVFDMIRRDKENRDMRNLRRKRLNKMYEKSNGIPQNTTFEDMEEIAKLTKKKERSELNYNVIMTLICVSVCIIIASVLVIIFIR